LSGALDILEEDVDRTIKAREEILPKNPKLTLAQAKFALAKHGSDIKATEEWLKSREGLSLEWTRGVEAATPNVVNAAKSHVQSQRNKTKSAYQRAQKLMAKLNEIQRMGAHGGEVQDVRRWKYQGEPPRKVDFSAALRKSIDRAQTHLESTASRMRERKIKEITSREKREMKDGLAERKAVNVRQIHGNRAALFAAALAATKGTRQMSISHSPYLSMGGSFLSLGSRRDSVGSDTDSRRLTRGRSGGYSHRKARGSSVSTHVPRGSASSKSRTSLRLQMTTHNLHPNPNPNPAN